LRIIALKVGPGEVILGIGAGKRDEKREGQM
jgi:hypothetical protein